MKKITFSLIALLFVASMAKGQVVATIQAPPFDGGQAVLSAPSGSPNTNYRRTSFLILQSELTALALTSNSITNIAFSLLQGVNAAAAGQATLYLENTTDVTYSKTTNWATILTGMTPYYTGAFNLPTTATNINMALSPNGFVYTGGGIYVALDWYGANTSATQFAVYASNYTGLTGGCVAGSTGTAGPAPTTLTPTNWRPCITLSAANNATNEVSVTGLSAPGKVSKLMGTGHTILAQIRNNSNVALTNIPVTLSVTGANVFTDTKTVTSIGAGSFQTVSFNAFNPTVAGLNNMTVTIPNDQLNSNNESFVWSQSVTCNEAASNPPVPANTFTETNYGFTAVGGGILSARYNPVANVDLQGIRLAVGTSTTNTGKQFFGVLMDATGNIVATTNTITATAAMLGTFVKFDFPSPQSLTAGTNYHLGIGIPVGPMYPLGTIGTPYIAPNYYASGIGGGALSAVSLGGGHAGIEAVLNFSDLEMNVVASKTIVCKAGSTTTLTATGANTYTYTRVGGPVTSTAGVAIVTPTITGTQGLVTYSVNGTNTTLGCRANQSIVSISITACTGLAETDSQLQLVSLFPNPANGKAALTGLVGTNNINVINVLGQSVLNLVSDEESVNLDLSNQPSGNYLVKITDSSNETRIMKLVVQN